MLTFLTMLLVAAPAPSAPSPQDAALEMIRSAIETARDGKFDAFIEQFCDPQRCHTPLSVANWKSYSLKAMRTNAGYCLHGRDQELIVQRWEGSLADDATAKVYLTCTNRQLPVPVELRWDAAASRPWIRAVSF